jgi:hypothetical protein
MVRTAAQYINTGPFPSCKKKKNVFLLKFLPLFSPTCGEKHVMLLLFFVVAPKIAPRLITTTIL